MDVVKVSTPGQPGISAYQAWIAAGNTGTVSQFLASLIGATGQSAYQAWLAEGNTGTIQQFLASLVGPEGAQGNQGVPGANAKWQTGQTYIGLLGTRCKSPTNGGQSSSKQHMARSIHTAHADITQIAVGFANWYVGTNGEVNPGGPSVHRSTIEYPLGVESQRFTFGGQTSGTAQDYTTIESDMLTLANMIPAGAQYAIREFRDCTSGAGAITFNYNSAGGILINAGIGDCYSYAASGVEDLTDEVGAFTSTGATPGPFSMPVIIVGPTNQRSYGILHDSRGEGYDDSCATSADVGEFARSIGPLRNYVNLSCSGETVAIAVGPNFRQRAAIAGKYCTDVCCGYGINDLFNSGTVAPTVIQYLEELRAMFPAQNFIQSTQSPETTSIDGFTTVDGQTTANANAEAQRRLVVNYLRSGIGRFDGIADICAVNESSLNSGLWKAPGCTTGVHETPAQYAAIAASGAVQVQ